MRVSLFTAALVTAVAFAPSTSARHSARHSSTDGLADRRQHREARIQRQEQRDAPHPISTPSPVPGSSRFDRRDDTNSSATTATYSSSPSASGSASSSRVALPTPPNPIPTTVPTDYAPGGLLPQVLDTTLTALDGSCASFVSDLTATTNFSTCLPLSLLLSSSSSFRNTLWDSANDSDYRYLNNLIAYTHSPQPSAEECDANFAQYYEEMPQKSNCAADLSNSATKAAASQALRGLGNYQVIRTASGFVNPDSGVYCYLEAVASERPDDLYLWQLPAGNILPSSSTPTCSACSGLLMNHFSSWMANTTSLNSTLLQDAVQAVNAKCGSTFVDFTAPVVKQSDGIHAFSIPSSWVTLGAVTILSWGLGLF